MPRKSVQAILMAACLIVSISGMAYGHIQFSKHDFSLNGGTDFGRTNLELVNGYPVEEICVFCHTPHNASPTGLLWNRTNPASTDYTLYTSSTLTMVTLEKPTGLTLMCMSCHDGITSIAVGALNNAPYSVGGRQQITLTGTGASKIGEVYVVPTGPNPFGYTWGPNIGNLDANGSNTVADLSNDHPVSFVWNTGMMPGIIDPADWTGAGATALKLYNNRMECSTCHDVHENANPPFLRMSNANSDMCTTCHSK